MALTFDVRLLTDESCGFQTSQGGGAASGRETMKIDYAANYHVYVSDPADPDFDPRLVSPFDVATLAPLPVVNRTTYTTPTGLVVPYVICRSKQVRRDPDVRKRFLVETRFDSGTSSRNEQGPVPIAADYSPKEEVTLGEEERVIYEDKDGKACVTPTGNFFNEPFVEWVPTINLRITQYEATPLAYETLRQRKHKFNSTTYRGEPPDAWWMKDVEFNEVEVPIAPDVTAIRAQVVYTLENTERPFGWLDERSLIDTHFLDDSGGAPFPKRAFQDEDKLTYTPGFIKKDGTKNETSIPEKDQWRTQDRIDFNSFLQI